MKEPKIQPNLEHVTQIVSRHFSEKLISAERFPSGRCHFVFEVVLESNKKFVIRLAKPENRHLLESAVFWNRLLKPQGVPLPEIFGLDLSAGFPYLILERLPGQDLWEVYAELTKAQKKCLALEMVNLQEIAGTLPRAKSFGYLETYKSGNGCRTWFDVLLKYLERSRQRMNQTRIFDSKIVDVVEKKTRNYQNYFSKIEPVPFFDDITTKNVIINNGKLSGIVDVDWMCFGDKLETVALTQMALLSDNFEPDYIEFWSEAMNLNTEQRTVLNLYTAISCVDFMSEIGKTFNKDAPLEADEKKVNRFFEILDNLLELV